ncbi:MAG: hypothetical protein AAGG02_10535 [Cyanobacteria bacterium P01_H01_bin.15]
MLELLCRLASRGYKKSSRHSDESLELYDAGLGNWREVESKSTEFYTKSVWLFITTIYRINQDVKKRFERFMSSVTLASEQDDVTAVFILQSPRDKNSNAKSLIENWIHEYATLENIVFGLVDNIGRKVSSINGVLKTLTSQSVLCIGWLDDDILFQPELISQMNGKFFSNENYLAIGATKQAIARKYRWARLLTHAKAAMSTPVTKYPSGCAILIDRKRFIDGIPNRYDSDDDYICFELISDIRGNGQLPWHINSETVCIHLVGGPFGQSKKRIRRSLLWMSIFLADYKTKGSGFYFTQIAFFGMWPITKFDRSNGTTRGIQKMILKYIYFVWFCRFFFELVIRGLISRPLETVDWAAYNNPTFGVEDE